MPLTTPAWLNHTASCWIRALPFDNLIIQQITNKIACSLVPSPHPLNILLDSSRSTLSLDNTIRSTNPRLLLYRKPRYLESIIQLQDGYYGESARFQVEIQSSGLYSLSSAPSCDQRTLGRWWPRSRGCQMVSVRRDDSIVPVYLHHTVMTISQSAHSILDGIMLTSSRIFV